MKNNNILNTREISERLRISEPTIRRMVKDGELPAFQAGVHLKFYWPAVEKAISGNYKEATK